MGNQYKDDTFRMRITVLSTYRGTVTNGKGVVKVDTRLCFDFLALNALRNYNI